MEKCRSRAQKGKHPLRSDVNGSQTMLHTFLSFFIVFFIILGIEGFGGNLSPPEVNERINGTVQLNCTAYEANGELNFFLDNNERVPETYIKRTNETYIEMIRVYSRPIKENYTCKQGFNNIDVSQVIVDKPMDRVVGFKCRTSNLTNVHCSFKMPLAFLPIEYRFFVALNDGKKAAKRTFLNQDGKGGYSADIKISESTNSLLNASLNCTLKAKNLFYRSSEEFNYQLLEILTPDPVADLKVLEDLTTHSSVFVTFSLPKVIEKVTSAMVFDVRLIDEDTFAWRNISSRRIQITGREGFLVIDNLEYANTRYTMKIRMKSSFAADDEEMWSTYKEISFKTSSKLPDNAPDTCENCFNVMDNGNIVVYWMEVPKLHQNAENFSYLIRGWDENEEELVHENLNRTSLLLHKSLFTSNVRIKFFSVNSFGVSKRFSELFIQKDLSQANRKHLKIRKELDNSEYKISWKNVEEFAVESYTVVWCQQRNELPNQCDGSIHFQTIPSNVSEFKIESPTSHHFGVAVNFQNKSLGRGIDWAECTAAKSNEIGQVHSVWSSVNTPNDITLHWKLNCVDEPIVKGFNITYCLADSKSINLCNDEVVILSDNEELNQHELKNLKPYRLYNISIALMSETRLGIPKAPIITRTLEGAPTAPRNFRDMSINQQSIDLTWNRPLEVNGASMTYQLWYNDHRININDNNTMNETFEFNLNNLDVFTNYTITVVACTSACSDSSESLTLRTAMGAPSAILQPKLKDLSERRVELSWETPIVLGGNLDYFQLKMIPSNKLGNLETKVFRIHRKTRSCYIEKFNCEDNVLFTIRAVNIEHRAENFLEEIPNNKSTNCFDIVEPIEGEVAGQYYSNWSQPVIHHCQSQMSLVMIAAVIITAVSTMTSLYLFVRLYQRYKEMKDIYIVWPKGLDPSEISSPTTSHDLYNAVKDLDLLKNHKLTGIQEEEEENAEQEVFLQIGPKPDEIFINSKQNEISMPFTVNTRANDYFHQKPKLMSTNNKTKSAPTSPEKKSNDYIEFSKDSVVEKGTGYTKMYVPQRITSGSVDGYLDMTGKNKSPVKSDSGYTLNEIKLFIKDSELKNNGYIGKRASILIDPQQKGAHKIISNGYSFKEIFVLKFCSEIVTKLHCTNPIVTYCVEATGTENNKFINVRRKMCPLEMLLALVVLCCSIALTESSVDGWTDPPGVIIQDRFSNIKLMCGVNGNKYTSNQMGFFNNSNQQWIDKKYIQVKNVSVIEMFLPNATEQESVIVCKLTNDQGISYNDIKVGRKPENITGLKCLSDDWHDMNCSFEKPHNHVPVQYSLSYRVAGSSQIYFCRPPVEKDPKIFSCFISRGAYRKTSATFEFILTAENDLGTKEQIIVLDNYATVVPAAPNLTAIKINSDSVVLLWEISQNLLVFPKPFDYEFLVVSPAECDPEPKKIRYNNVSSLDDAEQPRNFTHKINLKFANTWYDISIRMKISTANDSEEMWSQWAKKILLPTTTRRPDNPPSVDVGSFNIGRGGDIHIYWKHIPKCYQNAVNYTYIVTSNNKQFEDPNETNQHEAIYIKERVNLMKDTTFTIRSQNAVGMSKEAKTIVIPGESRRLDGPKKIKKILSNGSYYLSWSPPVQHQIEITSYTVFWCVAKSELENKCEGSIDFVRRLPSETYFEFTSNLSVNFAVSANSRDSTSGMVWAKCTTVNSNEIGKIRTIWIPRLTSSEIEVEWKLDCMDSGIVAGYQLEYCPYKEPQTLDCVEPEKKINITGRLDYPKHTLEGLTPYTQYKIIIRMFSNSTMGPPSDPQANTTLEAAPSEVRDLIARNIGNTSVELYWDPPANLNGVLLFYKVWANGKDYKVNGLDFKTVEIDNGFVTRMNYTLKDLFAFTEYDIAVEACTKECSKPSKTKIRTTIGAPGYFKQPSMKVSWDHSVKNYTSAIVTWEEPEFKGGNLDYYEVKTMSKARIDGNTAERIIKTRKRDCHIEELCKDAMVYGISVRAVNFVLTPHSKETQVLIEGSDDEQQCDMDDQVLLRSLMALKQADPHGWYLPGPWSTEVSHSCSGTVFDSKQYVMLMLLMVASIVIITMFFFSYRKIRDMKDILVQMPPGLEDSGNEKGKKGKDNSDMEKMGTPDILRNVDTASINCEDENGQLLKKSLNGSLNGGDCSSSLHSESTRSEGDNHDNEDEIEYGEFENDGITKRCGLQNFNVKTTPNKEIQPILMSPNVMPTSTPIVDKIRNPPLSLPSSGYVCQPPLKVVPPVLPSNSNGNGYVTHSMFNPMQSSGYTPLSAFRKPTISQNYAIEDKINTKTPIVATTDQEGISGYVTHKQLSDFGHRLQ